MKGDTKMSKIIELFGVEIGVKIGEKFRLEDKDGWGISGYYFDKDLELHMPGGGYSTITPLKILTGELRIEKPILDEVEKKFIGNIIRPFDIEYIQKVTWSTRKYFLYIRLKNGESIDFPCFSANSKMYRGMKPDKKYTPKDLGI